MIMTARVHAGWIDAIPQPAADPFEGDAEP